MASWLIGKVALDQQARTQSPLRERRSPADGARCATTEALRLASAGA